MLQNLKNFLIAFLAGIVVFGLCAILMLYAFSGSTASEGTSGGDEIVYENTAE